MKLYNLETTQPIVAHDITSAYDGGFLPQSLLFSGPKGSSRLTAALDLSFVLLGKEEDRELLASGNIVYFPHREFYSRLNSAISMFEKQRNHASRIFLIETVRTILFQYHGAVQKTAPSSMAPLFSLASDVDTLLMDYEKDKDYTDKEINTLVSFLKSKCLDAKFLYGGKRSPSPVSIDEIRGVQEWFASGANEKIAIFEDIEDATEGARNSLLKTLEEPDPHTHLILISSNPQKIMQTILSRVRKFNFPALSKKQISALLKDRFRTWEEFTSFDGFFFQTGSGDEARTEFERDVQLFVNVLITGKHMRREEEESLLNSLDKISSWRYFRERVTEELEKACLEGRISFGKAKTKLEVLNRWVLSADIYNMSDKNALDLMLREAEIVK